MKEAYLKKKLTELSERGQQIGKHISMLQNQLDRIEARVGEYKNLLKRLDDVSSFTQNSMKELKQQNTEHLEHLSDRLRMKNESLIKKQLQDKSLSLNEATEQVAEDAALFKAYGKMVKEAAISSLFLKEFHHLMLLKLVNKGVFTHREINEMKKRAEKRSVNNE